MPSDRSVASSYNTHKLVLIGPAKAGKTYLLAQHKNQPLNENYVSTVGVGFSSISDHFNNNKYHYWDTAGNKRFAGIVASYYKDVTAFVYIVDATSPLETQITDFWDRYTEICEVYLQEKVPQKKVPLIVFVLNHPNSRTPSFTQDMVQTELEKLPETLPKPNITFCNCQYRRQNQEGFEGDVQALFSAAQEKAREFKASLSANTNAIQPKPKISLGAQFTNTVSASIAKMGYLFSLPGVLIDSILFFWRKEYDNNSHKRNWNPFQVLCAGIGIAIGLVIGVIFGILRVLYNFIFDHYPDGGRKAYKAQGITPDTLQKSRDALRNKIPHPKSSGSYSAIGESLGETQSRPIITDPDADAKIPHTTGSMFFHQCKTAAHRAIFVTFQEEFRRSQ